LAIVAAHVVDQGPRENRLGRGVGLALPRSDEHVHDITGLEPPADRSLRGHRDRRYSLLGAYGRTSGELGPHQDLVGVYRLGEWSPDERGALVGGDGGPVDRVADAYPDLAD
jgi:hypothetical protein